MTALNAEVTTATVTWDVAALARDATSGDLVRQAYASAQIVFTPRPKLLLEQGAAKTITIPAPIPVAASAGTQPLIRTDCSVMSPGAWTWGATLQAGALSVDLGDFTLDDTTVSDGTADLAMLAQLPSSTGTPITRGEQGPPGAVMALTDSDDKTATFSWTDEDDTDHSLELPVITSDLIDASVVPDLDADKIASGTLDSDRIPDLSGIYVPIDATYLGIDTDGVPYFNPDGVTLSSVARLEIDTDGVPYFTTIGS